MNKTYELLRAAVAKPGCALCRVEREAVQRYLDGFMYEDVTDVDLRARMRAAHGFCREHAAQAILVRDSLGLAIIYQDILSTARKDISETAAAPRLAAPAFLRRDTPAPGQRLAQRVTSHRPCPACAVREEMAQPALSTLAASLVDPQIGPLFQQSDGLCLPHFGQVAALVPSQAALAALVERQDKVMDALVNELAEFIRKHDYRFTKEQMATEIDSWRRAMELVVGGTLKS